MSTWQTKTIDAADNAPIEEDTKWEIIDRFDDVEQILICERSGNPIQDCENKECSESLTHKTRIHDKNVHKVTVYKQQTNIVP